MALELIWAKRNITSQNYSQFFDFHDRADVRSLMQAKKPMIFLTYHFGNFELASLFMGFYGPGCVIVQQETKNPEIGEILTDLRTTGKNVPTSRTGVMLRLLKTLKRGGSIGILGDLTIPPGKTSSIVDFLGLKMCVTKIHVELARRTGAPIIPIIARPNAHDYTYSVETAAAIYVGPDDDADLIAQRCIDQLETWVKRDPHLWMWMYKHFRYQDMNHPEDYPFYANPKKSFQKRIDARPAKASQSA